MAVISHLGSVVGARSVREVTPHATDDLPDGICRALYIGGAGDVVLIANDDDEPVTFSSVPAGTMLSVQTKAVRSSSTATNILALY